MNRTHRKYLASVLLAIPTVVMFLENSSLVKDGGKLAPLIIELRSMADHLNTLIFKPTDYILFSLTSLAVFVVSLILAFALGSWRLSGSRSIGVFVRSFLSRYFVGELAKSIYGLFVFVMFAVTLTAWLPDALESGNLWFTLGTVFYFLSLIFTTAFVYPAPEKKEKSLHPAKTKYLVYALSVPSPRAPWTLIGDRSCEDLRRNRTGTNINPLYSSLYYHIDRLERVYLLVTENVHIKDKNSIMNQLRMFFEGPRSA